MTDSCCLPVCLLVESVRYLVEEHAVNDAEGEKDFTENNQTECRIHIAPPFRKGAAARLFLNNRTFVLFCAIIVTHFFGFVNTNVRKLSFFSPLKRTLQFSCIFKVNIPQDIVVVNVIDNQSQKETGFVYLQKSAARSLRDTADRKSGSTTPLRPIFDASHPTPCFSKIIVDRIR